MTRESLLGVLRSQPDPEAVAELAAGDGTVVPALLDIIETDRTAVKFLCEKIIRKIGEDNPRLLYPYFDRVERLIDSENSFIRWGFIRTLPNLLSVDADEKWQNAAAHYLSLLGSDSVVTFGNAVSGVPKILGRYPEYEADIVPRLLGIDGHVFLYKGEPSPECMNVAKEHIVECLGRIFERSAYKRGIIAFVRQNAHNGRRALGRKAETFLKKHGAAPA